MHQRSTKISFTIISHRPEKQKKLSELSDRDALWRPLLCVLMLLFNKYPVAVDYSTLNICNYGNQLSHHVAVAANYGWQNTDEVR